MPAFGSAGEGACLAIVCRRSEPIPLATDEIGSVDQDRRSRDPKAEPEPFRMGCDDHEAKQIDKGAVRWLESIRHKFVLSASPDEVSIGPISSVAGRRTSDGMQPPDGDGAAGRPPYSRRTYAAWTCGLLSANTLSLAAVAANLRCRRRVGSEPPGPSRPTLTSL